jgi:hypothetical protein
LCAAARSARWLHEAAVHLAERCTSCVCGRLGQGVLKLSIGLLLDGLSVLQLLNQLHLKHLHLHDLLLLGADHGLLFNHALLHLCLGLHLFSSHEFLFLKLRDTLLLFNHLVLLLCVKLGLREEHILPLLILYLNDSLLLDFFLLAKVNCLLNLLSFNFSLFAHMINPILSFLLHHLIYTKLLHLLLDFNLVFLLEGEDFVGTLFGFLDLFPSTHFLLLKEGDTIGKKLGISLNTT